MIPILILAAGQSSRMGGRDKLLEDMQGQPLLRRQAKLALATDRPVFVAVNKEAQARQAAIAGLPVTVLTVPEAEEGLSGTMRGAIAQLPSVPAFMMILADLVALELSDLQAVAAAREAHPEYLIWRGATHDGKPGHPIIFDAILRPEFAHLTGDNGGAAITKSRQDQTYLVNLPGDRARLDLDTPQEWDAWRKIIP